VQPDAGEAGAKPPRSDPGSLLAAVGQAVIATDRSGRIQYWSLAAQDLYGYTAQEVSGRPLIEVIAPPEAEHLVTEWTARLGADESYAGDWPVRDKAGRIFTAYVTLTSVLDDQGSIVGAVGVSYDVSLQRETEARARRLAAIVDGANDAIIEVGPDGRVRHANAAVERVFGYLSEELIGRDLELLIPEDRAAEMVKLVEAILTGRRVDVFTTKRRRKDGSLIDAALRLSPVRDESGSIVGVSETTRDVSAEM
jgi:PAS domain S-box-containing protein